MPFIPLSEPDLGIAEANSVQQVTEAGWVSTAGPEISRFESAISQLLGNKQCVALNSGTAALHLALHLLPEVRNSVVLIPDLTFAGTVNAVLMAGAEPILIDIEPDTWGMDPTLLEQYLKTETRPCQYGRQTLDGRNVAGIIYVPVHGNPGNIMSVQAICKTYGVFFIEDAAAALGSRTTSGACGTLGDISTLSFNGNKILTTGGGGMLCSSNAELVLRARHIAQQSKVAGTEYFHNEPGFNYGMTNLSAALGLAQATRFERMLARKQTLHTTYRKRLYGLATFQDQLNGDQSNGWLSTILVPDRNRVLHELASREIGCRPIWQPLHTLPFLTKARYYSANNSSVSYLIYNQAVSIPSGSKLTEEQVEHVISSLQHILTS